MSEQDKPESSPTPIDLLTFAHWNKTQDLLSTSEVDPTTKHFTDMEEKTRRGENYFVNSIDEYRAIRDGVGTTPKQRTKIILINNVG